MPSEGTWQHPSNLIAGIAALLSLVSLGVSVRSCVQADRSLELATADFRGARSLVLVGKVAEQGDAIELRPQDPEIVLQEARALFPSELTKDEWPVQPPERRLYVVVLRFGLEKAVEQRVPRQPGTVTYSADANVPVVITSLFTAKGEGFEDRSLYRIMYSFLLDGDEPKPPQIDFKGLLYVGRLPVNDDPRKVLDGLWRETTWKK